MSVQDLSGLKSLCNMKKRLILLAAGALLLAAGCDRKVTLNEPNWDPRVREALDALIA